MWLAVVMVAVFGGRLSAACEPQTSQALLTLPGRAYLAGIFDIHEGENCSVEISAGRQKMAAAAWVVSALNWQLTEPDLQLGLRVYDACSSELSSQMAFMAAAVDADCKETYSLGVVTSAAVWSRVVDLAPALPLAVSGSGLGPQLEGRAVPLLLETAAGLLRAAHSRGPACLLAASPALLDAFRRRAALQELCLPPPHHTLLLEQINTGWSAPQNGTCVVLGPWAQAASAVSALAGSGLGWLLVPTDGVPEDREGLSSVPAGALLVEPRLSLGLSAPAGNASVSYAAFLDVAAAAASAAATYHAALRQRCGFAPEDYTQCLALLPPIQELQATPAEDGGAALRGLLEAAGAAWLSPAASRVTSEGRLQPVAAYSSVDGDADGGVQLVLTADLELPQEGNETCYTYEEVEEGAAPDVEPAGEPWPALELEFRPEPWAAAVAAVVCLGLAVCAAVGGHLAWRVAAGDVLEGRPALTALLVVATAAALAAAAAFLVQARRPPVQALLCAARASAAALCYALLFSLMLARALMLAACDADGAVASSFLSHINGYLQSSLCFLMALTPSALVLQFWLGWGSGAGQREACHGGGVALSLQLGCDALLLLLLVSVAPLAARSRRNYREGACFLAAALLMAACWAGWLAAFLAAGDRWRDAALSGGLAATASCVIVAVLVPRTYLMLSSAVRSHLAGALPGSLAASACALNSAAALGGVGLAGSQQGLYASVNPDLAGHGGGNFYSPDAGLPFGGSPRAHGKLSHF